MTQLLDRIDARPGPALARMRGGVAWLALLVAVSACQTAPSAVPAGGASPAPASAGEPSAPAGSQAAAGLAEALRDAVSVDDIIADLGRLDAIARENNGNRSAGSPGYDASVALVSDALRDAGYDVTTDPTPLTAFSQDAPTVLEIQAAGAPAIQDIRDVKAMLLSPSGDVTAPLVALGFDPGAQPGDRNGLGCDPADFEGVPEGSVVLVQAGNCRRFDVVMNAQAAGVVGLITSYPEWVADHVLRPTLIDPSGIRIPAVGVTGATGIDLFNAAEAGSQVHLAVRTTVAPVQSPSVIAETPGGDPAHVVMIGGHLDSVIDGPGINDNGSGTMSILEIARELAALRPEGAPWKVRFAFWTGEEIGLLGAFDYTGALSSTEIQAIEAYLNFDMLGSPNGVREVYDTDQSSRPKGSDAIADLLGDALTSVGLTSEVVDIGGASDHLPFDQRSVPIGGLFSGAGEIKTPEEAALFGGTAGAPQDPCYHRACDTVENIDRVLLEQLAKAAAWTLGRLAEGSVTLPEG